MTANVPCSPSSRAFVIAGPTGAGKSAFAAALASRAGGEVVCGDAFQLYRGLAAITAQPGPGLCQAAPHHLYGSVDPAVPMSAAAYAALAAAVIEEIASRGRIPMVVGGSGLYLRALFGGFDTLPEPDPALRERVRALDPAEAVRELKAADPAAGVDFHNPRRVARALEIVLTTGLPLAASRTGRRAPLRGVVLVREPGDLRRRIAGNVAELVAGAAEREVAAISGSAPTASRAIGFRELRAMLEGRLSREAARRAIEAATWQYARRQLTWFRHQTTLAPLMPDETSSIERALRLMDETQ